MVYFSLVVTFISCDTGIKAIMFRTEDLWSTIQYMFVLPGSTWRDSQAQTDGQMWPLLRAGMQMAIWCMCSCVHHFLLHRSSWTSMHYNICGLLINARAHSLEIACSPKLECSYANSTTLIYSTESMTEVYQISLLTTLRPAMRLLCVQGNFLYRFRLICLSDVDASYFATSFRYIMSFSNFITRLTAIDHCIKNSDFFEWRWSIWWIYTWLIHPTLPTDTYLKQIYLVHIPFFVAVFNAWYTLGI